MALDGGTGSQLGHAAIIVAGVCSLIATLLAFVSIWLQLKNYRKPLLQRYVVRILLMVPIYAISSWVSLMSITAAMYIDPIRDVYEAFTIYTFFQLLINYLGGERALIIMTHGRAPKEHLWPMNYVLAKVDISDPHTFLAIKRGILQYAWMKPILGLAAVIMKATGTYQEGYVGLKSGYFWSGIIYNISVTVSLYSLGMFWVCTSRDLQPFRPVPKFLCVKLIIFASYWQGFFLSILVWLGVIRDVGHYTPDNLAAAIQDALICFELPGFAIAHWNAFSWKDYADVTKSAARMSVMYALRDAFGIRDLIEDSKITFKGKGYDYRLFDPAESVLEHPDSGARVNRMMEGLRYHKGGKSKYWIPKPTATTGLLSTPGPSSSSRPMSPAVAERGGNWKWYGDEPNGLEELEIDEEDEKLFEDARKLEYGDYNYPVITAYEPLRNVRTGGYSSGYQSGGLTTTATNQAVLHGKPKNVKGKGKDEQKKPLLTRNKSSTSSHMSDRSGIVHLVIEDREAEDLEAVRTRNDGGPGWNNVNPKKFIRNYPEPEARNIVEINSGHLNNPLAESNSLVKAPSLQHRALNSLGFVVGEDGEDGCSPQRQQNHNPDILHDRTNTERPWTATSSKRPDPVKHLSYENLNEERNPWSN
ncbi:organic solute transporter Ostalpha-domain-containing protein [Tirmania nivea]|nr:organic solute transporter Ostalpha-domain-containing protein [Tirmania nivea]